MYRNYRLKMSIPFCSKGNAYQYGIYQGCQLTPIYRFLLRFLTQLPPTPIFAIVLRFLRFQAYVSKLTVFSLSSHHNIRWLVATNRRPNQRVRFIARRVGSQSLILFLCLFVWGSRHGERQLLFKHTNIKPIYRSFSTIFSVNNHVKVELR